MIEALISSLSLHAKNILKLKIYLYILKFYSSYDIRLLQWNVLLYFSLMKVIHNRNTLMFSLFLKKWLPSFMLYFKFSTQKIFKKNVVQKYFYESVNFFRYMRGLLLLWSMKYVSAILQWREGLCIKLNIYGKSSLINNP